MEETVQPPKPKRTVSSQHSSQAIDRLSVARSEHRPLNTVSMYAGIGKQKIYPRQRQGQAKSTASRHSQSMYGQKSPHKSLIRSRRIQAVANESSFSALNPLKQFKRQALRGQMRATLTQSQSKLKLFFDTVQTIERQFLSYCLQQKQSQYTNAAQVIVKLLNYTVDFNLPQQFLKAIKMLADFYFFTDKITLAIFYYDQAREASLLLDHPIMLIQALIGMASCCGKIGGEIQGIRILKKGLQYCWYRELEEQQLRIYDEIGDIQKAKQYHSRHINALHQSPASALLILSKQRLIKSQQINLQSKYKTITRLLLIYLKLPIRNLQQVPLPYQQKNNQQPIRKSFKITNKYNYGNDINYLLKKIFQDWFFRQEIQDPSQPDQKIWSATKPKKYAFLDFQLNKQLKRLAGTHKSQKKQLYKTIFPIKQSIQEKVTRKMKQPPLEHDWYQKIVKQINRDHRNKLLNVRNAVRIRGFNKKTIPSTQLLKDLFTCMFERSKNYQHFNNHNVTFKDNI